MNTGPLGQKRGTGFVILVGIVTLGFYWWYWAYKTGDEMKQRTGDGLGGLLSLIVWILLPAVMAFVIPSEIGKMAARDGKPSAVTGWTGLWMFPFGILIIPYFVWWVKVQGALNRYWDEAQAPSAAAEAAPATP